MLHALGILAYVYAAGVLLGLLVSAIFFLWTYWKKLSMQTHIVGWDDIRNDPEFLQSVAIVGGRLVPKPMNARKDAQAEDEEDSQEVRFEPGTVRIVVGVVVVFISFLWPIFLGSYLMGRPLVGFSLGGKRKSGGGS